MASGDEYRLKAAEINERAKQETTLAVRAELKKLALAYLLLAEQADSNAKTDIVYEPPPERQNVQQQRDERHHQPQQQQQQSQQPSPDTPKKD
jgi:hypothetical protein